MIEIVVVLSVGVGNMLASATYRFGTSWQALKPIGHEFFRIVAEPARSRSRAGCDPVNRAPTALPKPRRPPAA